MEDVWEKEKIISEKGGERLLKRVGQRGHRNVQGGGSEKKKKKGSDKRKDFFFKLGRVLTKGRGQ